MKFTDLAIEGFGVWSGLEVCDLSPRLTVIFGANEAGKTTVLQAIRGTLYGYNVQRRDRYSAAAARWRGHHGPRALRRMAHDTRFCAATIFPLRWEAL